MSTKKVLSENVELYSAMMVREFLKTKGLKRALAVFDAETKRVRNAFFCFDIPTTRAYIHTHNRLYRNTKMRELR
jgi:hypothetical protein